MNHSRKLAVALACAMAASAYAVDVIALVTEDDPRDTRLEMGLNLPFWINSLSPEVPYYSMKANFLFRGETDPWDWLTLFVESRLSLFRLYNAPTGSFTPYGDPETELRTSFLQGGDTEIAAVWNFFHKDEKEPTRVELSRRFLYSTGNANVYEVTYITKDLRKRESVGLRLGDRAYYSWAPIADLSLLGRVFVGIAWISDQRATILVDDAGVFELRRYHRLVCDLAMSSLFVEELSFAQKLLLRLDYTYSLGKLKLGLECSALPLSGLDNMTLAVSLSVPLDFELWDGETDGDAAAEE